ncbi:MAG: hypothetical protein J6A03_03760 [Lachnospiraceae bacterium]|nr:hypothetical protein [Lachnospiraceae bacterium]
MSKVRGNIKNIGLYFAVFWGGVLLKSLTLFGSFQMKFFSDNIGVLFTPALLSGRDWTGLIQNFAYYGWAYYILFTPLFLLTKNPYVIYNVICFTNIFVLGLIGVLIYYIIRTYFQQISTACAVVIAIICTNYGIVFSWNFTSELPALLMVWLVVFLICKCYEKREEKKQQILSTILLVVVLVWATNVHTRLMMVWLVLIAVVLGVWIFYKEKIVHLLTFIVGTLIGIPLAQVLKKIVIAKVWTAAGESSLRNAELLNTERLVKVSVDIKVAIDIVLSNLYKLTMETYGLAWILFVGLIMFLIWYIRNKRIKKREEYVKNEVLTVSLMLMFAVILVGTICGLIINYGTYIAQGFASGGENTLFSGLTYIRYYYIFFGPIVVTGFALIISYSDVFKKYGIWVMGLFLCLMVYIAVSVLPHLSIYFVNYIYSKFFDNNYISYILTISLLLASIMLGCFLLYKKKFEYYFLFLLILVVVLKLPVSYSQLYYLQPSERGGNAIYSVIEMAETETDIPKYIYMQNDERAMASIQFLLNDYSIIMGYPDEEEEEGLYFASSYRKEDAEYLMNLGYDVFHLDDKEYLWVKGETLRAAIDTCVSSYWVNGNSIYADEWSYEKNSIKVASLIWQKSEGLTASYYMGNIPGGMYSFDFDMGCLYSPDDEVGMISILQNDKLIAEQSITLTDCYNHTVKVEDIYVNENASVTVQIKLNKRVIVNNLHASYRNQDASVQFTDSILEQFSQFGRILKQLNVNKDVYLISLYNEYLQIDDFSELDKVLGCTVTDVIKDGDARNFSQNAIIILEKNSDTTTLFELVERYDIIMQTDDYTMLLYHDEENSRAIQDAGLVGLSYAGCIDVDYFRYNHGYFDNNVINQFPRGIYRVELEKSALDYTGVMNVYVNDLFLVGLSNNNITGTMYLNELSTVIFYKADIYSPEIQSGRAYVTRQNEPFADEALINFSENSDEFYLSNTSGIEEWGRWSIDSENELSFNVKENSDITVEMQLHSIKAQSVKVYANGELIATEVVEETPKIYTFEVPASCVRKGFLTLTFEAENIWNAGEVCHTDDKRMIGLGFDYMIIRYKEEDRN